MLSLLDDDEGLPRQIMQEKLADRARLVAALMACSGELMLVVDPHQRRLVHCNELALRELEWSRDALACLDLGALFDSAALEVLLGLCTAGHTDRAIELDARCRTGGDATLDLRMRAMPVQLDGSLQVLLIGTELRDPPRSASASSANGSDPNQISESGIDEPVLRRCEGGLRGLAESMDSAYLFFSKDPAGALTYVSPGIEALLGYGREAFMADPEACLTDNPINAGAQAACAKTLAGEQSTSFEVEMWHRSGALRRLRITEYPIFDTAGRITSVQGLAQDITESWRNQLLLDARNRVLEQLARGRPLSEILNTLTTHIEAVEPAMFCWVLLFDAESRRLFAASASSLPRSYTEAVDGIEVHAELGSCGAAACTGQRVVVADILTHPYWTPFRDLILRTELRACWSEPIRSADGRVLGTFAMYFKDIREPTEPELAVIASAADLAAVVIEHCRATTALRAAEEQARLLLESSTEGIFGLDTDGYATFINPAAADMLDYAPNDVIGRNLHSLIHHSSADGRPHAEQDCRLLAAMRQEQTNHVDDEVFWRRDGSHFPVEYHATPIRRQGQVAGAVVTFHDITERHRTEREIQHLAFHDALTGLPNRLLFGEELTQTLARFRSRGERFALHLMDVDHFKDVNDSLGHPSGDRLLCAIAKRISDLIRGADVFARLGGDEFGVIQAAIHSPADASLLATRIIESMSVDFDVDGITVRSNTSIGIVVVDDAADLDATELLSRADVALYKAKESGRGGLRLL